MFSSSLVIQQHMVANWFKDKELALATGITIAVSHLGGVVNFLFTESFYETFGLLWTLWGGENMFDFKTVAVFVDINN